MTECHKNTERRKNTRSAAILFPTFSVCDVTYKASTCTMCKKYQMRCGSAFFCPSLVASEPTWLCCEEPKFPAKEHFLSKTIDKAKPMNHADENIGIYSAFLGQRASSGWLPLNSFPWL